MKQTPMPPRSKPLARRAGLVTRTPLTSATTLESHSTLERSGPLKPVSKKRAAENRVRRAMVAALFPERPLCVVYVLSQEHPGVIPAEVISRCGRWADDVHEPLTRARGGSITDPGNATPPCRPCHGELGREPGWGYELGLLVHSWAERGDGNLASKNFSGSDAA